MSTEAQPPPAPEQQAPSPAQQPTEQAPQPQQKPPYTLDPEQQTKVLKQVEFYFSDSNLPKDKFLKGKAAEDPAGYVDLRIIAAFARMREMLKINNADPKSVPEPVLAAVANLIRSKSQALEINDQGLRVRRKIPLANTEVISAEIDARSLYAKPFPMDVYLDKLTEFFAQYAPVNCVRMRRHFASKAFKGSVFVEFASVADAEKVLGQKLEYANAPLKLEKKQTYMANKIAERKAKGNKLKEGEDDAASNDELSDGVGGKAGGEILESRRSYIKENTGALPAKQQESKKRGREETGDEGGSKGQKQQKGQQGEGEEEEGEDEEMEEQEEKAIEYKQGCLFSFSLEGELPENVGPFNIKDLFGGREKVVYVEVHEDKKGGIIRYPTPEAAAEALSAFNARPEEERSIASLKATLKRVEGEEEHAFYKRAFARRKDDGRRGKRGGARGGRGRRGGRGGRGGRGNRR